MKKLGQNLDETLKALGGNNSQSRINRRAVQVRERYKQALTTVYGPNTDLFLAHTNNVYIMDKDGVRTLIVYVDESIFATELNAQRELIRLKLLELFGEEIERFDIHISRGNYKKNHPYLSETSQESNEETPSIPLDSNEKSLVSSTAATVEDPKLRESLRNAMTANLEWKKGEKAKNTRKSTK